MTGRVGWSAAVVAGVLVVGMLGVSPASAEDGGVGIAAGVRYTTVNLGDLGSEPSMDWPPGSKDFGWVSDLNDRGQVLGVRIGQKPTGTFIWDPVTGVRFLGYHRRTPALNNRGQVAACSSSGQLILWDPVAGWRPTDLVRCDSVAGINERGQVAVTGSWHAVLWDPATGLRDLGPLGEYGAVKALNERGQVAGSLTTESGTGHAFRWDPAAGMRDLGTLGGNQSGAVALNERGQVAGWATTKSGAAHAFLWGPATGMRDLGTLGGETSEAVALNERGQVAGWSHTKSGERRTFLWGPATGMRDLGPLGLGAVGGLNDRGQVAGWVNNWGDPSFAFLWDSTTGLRKFAPWSRAVALNERGQVAGKVGRRTAVLFTPSVLAPHLSVKVARVDKGSRLRVNVNPDRGTPEYWTFRIQKRTRSGSWTTLPTTYKTEGADETRTINLRAGTYRVKANPKYGYLGATSAAVRILR